MLTIEMLQQSSALAGLTGEQFAAIAEMSKNDENVTIGTKIGALHGQYDADIFGVTGVKKRDGEKSYDYAKRVLADFKSKADSVKSVESELAGAKAQVTDLQTKLEKSVSDETITRQLKDTKAQVQQLQAQLQSKETELAARKEEFDNAIKSTHVDYAFQTAVSGIKFKPSIPESVRKVLLDSAKAEVLAKGSPDFVGGKLVLRGADGNILNNPKNNLNPYTMQELVMETSLKDVVDNGHVQVGGGTQAVDSKGNGYVLDLSNARNQVEADKVIESHLLSNGLTRDSQEFAAQLLQLRGENNVASLPIK